MSTPEHYYLTKIDGSPTAYGRPPEKLDYGTRAVFDLALYSYTQILEDGTYTAEQWIDAILKHYKNCYKTRNIIEVINKVMPQERPNL